MKKYLITSFLLFCLIAICKAQKTDLVFQQEIIDLGKIHPKDETNNIEINFVFYNKGDKPLIIYKVSTVCGCTTPSWSKRPINPNEKSIIKVLFKTKEQKGIFSKNLFVESNAKEAVKLLKIKGEIK